MMATANVRGAIQDLRARIGGIAAALVSGDGGLLFADVPAEVHPETFAVMSATVFGAAVTAAEELGKVIPSRIVAEGTDATTIIVGCGRRAILVAVVPPTADLSAVTEEIRKFADLLQVN